MYIDREIKAIIDSQYEVAREILTRHGKVLMKELPLS